MRTRPSWIVGTLLIVGLAACGNAQDAPRFEGGKADSVHSHALALKERDPAKWATGRDERVATTATIVDVADEAVTIETDQVVIDLPANQSVNIDLPEPWTQGVFAANRAFQVDQQVAWRRWQPINSSYFKELRLYGEGGARGRGVYFTGERFLGEDMVNEYPVISIPARPRETLAPRRVRVRAFPIAKWGEWVAGDSFGTTVRLRYRCEHGTLTIRNQGAEAMTLTRYVADHEWGDATEGLVAEPGATITLFVERRVSQVYLESGEASRGDEIHAVELSPATGCVSDITLH